MFKISLVFIGLLLNPIFGKYFEECLEVAEDTLIAVANDCRAYIYCSDEENSYQDTCPEDTYFAGETGECLIDYDNICPKANYTTTEEVITKPIEEEENAIEISLTTPAAITTTPPTLTTIYEHIVDKPSRPKCDRDSNGYYPHSERCEYYYKCVAGYLTILRCNFFYAWDYHKEMCVPSNRVQCYDTAKLNNFKLKLPGKIVTLL